MAEENNHFNYKKLFPDFKSILNREAKDFDTVFQDSLFVLDTNSLLAPYGTGKKNIEEIRLIYEKLINNKRLFIPAHVLREFAKNRSIKISELYSNIDTYLSAIPSIKNFEYPILGELEAYKKLNELIEAISKNIKEYKIQLNDLKFGITNWNWADPVSSMYSKTFTEQIIIDVNLTEEELVKEYYERLKNNIPPGGKDKSKEENAIGDFLIWKSILELGLTQKRNIIFVSNDEKSDWMLKGNTKSISTKFELVDEFFRYTSGNTFVSIPFSYFLEKLGLEIEFQDIKGSVLNSFQPDIDTVNTDSLKALKKIEKIISNFLVNELKNDVPFIENKLFEVHINDFIKSWRMEFQGTNKWDIYFHHLLNFEMWLTEILSLNGTIQFIEYRAKRDSSQQHTRMIRLLNEFLREYSEFIKIDPKL